MAVDSASGALIPEIFSFGHVSVHQVAAAAGRHIDCASGHALAAALRVGAIPQCRQSLAELAPERYLVHWPFPELQI
jgi:hypothetical protein